MWATFVLPNTIGVGTRSKKCSLQLGVMKHIVSLSIHLGHFPDYNSGQISGVESFRAILWDNFIPKHDDILWVAEFWNENIFELLSELKRSAKDWASRHGDCHIVGIDDGAPCWPIDSSLAHLPVQELDLEIRRKVVFCGGFKGLFGSIKLVEEEHQIQVFDVLPLPQHQDVADSVLNCSYWSPNAFVAAEQLKIMAQASARRLRLPNVSGLDDAEACWVQGFAKNCYV